jgi:hypothetical protein
VINEDEVDFGLLQVLFLSPVICQRLQHDSSDRLFVIDDATIECMTLEMLLSLVSGNAVALSKSECNLIVSVCGCFQNTTLEKMFLSD